jgi:hypothetical protein
VPDEQDRAEAVDEEEAFGAEHATSDMSGTIEDPIPERPMGVPFADADVTDESVADRAAREEPEVWEQPATSAEDRDLLEMADPLEIREGVEIVRDVDLDALPEDTSA